eukprot:COSAG06_NODE_6989_length_2685_cov_5.871230_3_plen_206_part_00
MGGCKTCEEKSLPLSAGCEPLFTGHFCSTCIENYELKPVADSDDQLYECVQCESSYNTSGVATIVALLLVVLIVANRNKLLAFATPRPERLDVLRTIVRSGQQPLRILITYVQVTGELGQVLDFKAPLMFEQLAARLSGIVSGLDVLSSAKCLGIDTFHFKWWLQVVIIPVALMILPTAGPRERVRAVWAETVGDVEATRHRQPT